MELFWFVLIGICAGWLAGQIIKGGHYGLIGDLVVGVVGSLIGGYLFGLLDIHMYGMPGRLVTATAGAVVLIAVLRLLRRRSV